MQPSSALHSAELFPWRAYEECVEPHLFRCKAASGNDGTAGPSLEAALVKLPKSDFHCHLNGSISAPILAHMEGLLQREEQQAKNAVGNANGASTSTPSFFSSVATACRDVLSTAMDGSRAHSKEERMQHCFAVFDNVYKIMTNLAFTRLAVQDMLFASAAENMFATEIRTSLRDGMRRSFTCETGVARQPCSKDMYVEAVVTTVEHVLRGGRVCFATGELLTPNEWRAHAETREAWLDTFSTIYGAFLCEPDEPVRALCTRLEQALAQMHVRLLISINRGGKVETAKEAVAIAKRMQQRQVRAFHGWCVAHVEASSTGNEVLPFQTQLAERLRSTCWVTGMDLSGNCYRGALPDFLDALSEVRRAPRRSGATRGNDSSSNSSSSGDDGLPSTLAITMHAGEKLDEAELTAMVAFRPERWGHLVFTDPANLSRILADHGGVELCITSNLLTGGHEEVKDHHLTHVMQTWWALTTTTKTTKTEKAQLSTAPHTLPEGLAKHTSMVALLTGSEETSRLGGSRGVYARTAQLRRLRRCARWSSAAAQALHSSLSRSATAADADESTRVALALPNVAFHTDDRGVFQTRLAHELYLAAQHPAVYFNADITSALRRQQRLPPNLPEKEVRDVVRAMWALQRLALPQLFELPWIVWEVVFLALAERPCPYTADKDDVNCGIASVLATRREAIHQCGPASQWKNWSWFVSYSQSIASSSSAETGLAVAASEVELMWLTECFDHYRLEDAPASESSTVAISVLASLGANLQSQQPKPVSRSSL